jgi:hypothetical protein
MGFDQFLRQRRLCNGLCKLELLWRFRFRSVKRAEYHECGTESCSSLQNEVGSRSHATWADQKSPPNCREGERATASICEVRPSVVPKYGQDWGRLMLA